MPADISDIALQAQRANNRCDALEHYDEVQNGHLEDLAQDVKAINNRINQLFGGVAVSCILLAINLVLDKI